MKYLTLLISTFLSIVISSALATPNEVDLDDASIEDIERSLMETLEARDPAKELEQNIKRRS